MEKELDRKLIGRRFAEQRIRKGLENQIDLINDFKEKTGVELLKSAVSMYENGKRMPEHDLLSKFADYFGVTMDYLYGKSGAELATVKTTLNYLAALFEDLSENDREQAVKYMEQLNIIKKG